MDKTGKFLLPSPKFKTLDKPSTSIPHFLSPQGMLLPKEKQPPPMYGPRGATFPPKFLNTQREPATNNQGDRVQKYFCEPCEAEFHTSTDYKVHKSEHTLCEIDKCSFRGHPSFMDTHIAQQHATGLYDQLKKLSTPEEIAQWRSDRKKNYPTVAIVAQKEKAREQRMLRGERLGENTKRFGRQSDRRPMRGDKQDGGEHVEKSKKRHRKRNKPGRQDNRKPDKKEIVEQPVEQSVEKEVDEEPTCGGLMMFKGTGGMADYQKAKKVETHALSSLLGMYGSDSDDGSEEDQPTSSQLVEKPVAAPEEMLQEPAEPQNKVEEPIPDLTTSSEGPSQTPTEDSKAEPTQTPSSDDEAPEEAPIAKSSNHPDKPQSEPPRKKPKCEPTKRYTLKSGLDYRKLRGRRQNTMLEKLLEPDIRHERNVLLQCVRFVVENNFFGIGSAPP